MLPGPERRRFLGPLVAVGALLSPGPRRGREILRWHGVAAIGAGAIALAELSKGPEFDIPLMRGRIPWLVIATVLTVTAGVCLASPAGRRLLAALAMPGLAYASYLIRGIAPGWWPLLVPREAVLLLPAGLAVGELVFLVAGHRRRRRVPPRGPHPAGR